MKILLTGSSGRLGSRIRAAPEAAGHEVVLFDLATGGKALGMLEREPDYLPMHDAHRGRPSLPYSEHLPHVPCAGRELLGWEPKVIWADRHAAIATASGGRRS